MVCVVRGKIDFREGELICVAKTYVVCYANFSGGIKMNKVTWYTIKDGKIGDVCILKEGEKPKSENKQWIKSPTNNVLHPESPIARYDENMRYLSDQEWLKKQGKKDPRGRWHHKGREKQEVEIYDVDSTGPGDEYTQLPPLKNEPHQYFDEKAEVWIVDTEKKELAEKEAELGKLKAEITAAEQKRIRSILAIIDNLATEEDLEYNERFKAQIEALRPQIKDAEAELKVLVQKQEQKARKM